MDIVVVVWFGIIMMLEEKVAKCTGLLDVFVSEEFGGVESWQSFGFGSLLPEFGCD